MTPHHLPAGRATGRGHRNPARALPTATVTGLVLAVGLGACIQSQAARSGADYVLLPATQNGTAAWDSCDVIRYRVNRNGFPRPEVKRLRQAFDPIESVTNLRFRYEGPLGHPERHGLATIRGPQRLA